jgi:L-cystine transport system substrate-binding protein
MKRQILAASLVFLFAGAISFSGAAHGADVRVIEVAFGGLGRPFSYLDENNEIQGSEADILRAIDELIPEYSFHFNAMERDAETVGLKSGKYQIGCGNHFYSKAREENYNLTALPINYSPLTLIVPKDNDTIKSLFDMDGKSIQPIAHDDALYVIFENFLKENPNIKIRCDNVAGGGAADNYMGVIDGRWDAVWGPRASFEAVNGKLDLPLKAIEPIDYMPSYFMLNKDETDLLEKVNAAIKTLTENGWLAKHSEEIYGTDVWAAYSGVHPKYNEQDRQNK